MKSQSCEFSSSRAKYRIESRCGIVVAVLVVFGSFASVAQAQSNALLQAVDSPIKMDPEPYAANEIIKCSLPLPASAALFGTDTKAGVGPAACSTITNELFSPFRIFMTDCALGSLSTWSTVGVVGTTLTGIGYPNGTGGTTYWACDPFGGATITEYGIGTGIATGMVLPTPVGGSIWGSLVVDDNQAGEILCINEIAIDATTCINAAGGGSVICFYPNADNGGGGGAFGNGTGDAVNPGDCSGQTLVNASGTITEGQVLRVGQYDCTGTDPACADRWDLSITGSFFINGIEEFTTAGGERSLLAVDNVTSTLFILQQPVSELDCQDIDPDMDLVWVNGSQGGGSFNVNVDTNGPLSVGIQKTGAGNGKFVHHMNAGTPSASTVGPLFDLGNECFPFVGGSPSVVENNVGKTNLVGSSNYFGVPIADPGKAPVFLASLLQPNIDTANLGAGQQFTHQLIALNGAASSAKGGSLSNAVVMTMQ